MARIVLTHEGAVLKEYPINKERMTIGRKPINDIQLDDPTVSGTHAAIVSLQNAYVEDMNSTNGVILNGKKVTRRQLNHGDMIRVGRHELKYVDDITDNFESTVIINPPSIKSLDATARTRRYQVEIMNGPKSGERIDLTKPYTTLGKPGVQVAVVARRGGDYYLMPMAGHVGAQSSSPLLNGTPLSASSQRLNEGDSIQVAGVTLRFCEMR